MGEAAVVIHVQMGEDHPLHIARPDAQGELGFQRMKAMARQRSHSIEFKRQVAQEFIGGGSLFPLSTPHDISRPLIPLRGQKHEDAPLDESAPTPHLPPPSQAKNSTLAPTLLP